MTVRNLESRDSLPARPRAHGRRRRGGRRQARRRHPRLRRERAARHHRRVPALLGAQRPAGQGDRRRRSRSGCARSGAKPVRREGEREGRWVLLDYVDIIVHVQHAEERDLLLARAALEGLPGGRAARRGPAGHSRVDAPSDRGERRPERTDRRAAADRPLAARADGLERWRTASRAAPTSSSTTSGRAQARPGGPPAGVPGAGRHRVLGPRPGRATPPTALAPAGRPRGAARPTAARDVRRRLAGPDRRPRSRPWTRRPTPRGGPATTSRPAAASGAPRSRPGSVPAIVEARRRGAGRRHPRRGDPRRLRPGRDRHPAGPPAATGGRSSAGWRTAAGRCWRRPATGPVAGGWSSTTRAACRSR